MKYRTRTFYTDKQKSEMWDRWQRGESMSSIGRHFNRASSSIFPHLAQFGGIRPAARKRSCGTFQTLITVSNSGPSNLSRLDILHRNTASACKTTVLTEFHVFRNEVTVLASEAQSVNSLAPSVSSALWPASKTCRTI